MKLREHFTISKRAVKMMFAMDKTFTLCLILSSLLSALTPYIPIYFSAKLIDALYAGAPVKTLALYAGLTAGLTFLLALIVKLISSVRSQAANSMYRAERWQYSEKAMSMAYESIENREVKLLLERIKKEGQTGFNLYYINSCMESYISNITKITVSLSLTFSFFTLPAIPLYMKLLLAAGIAATITVGLFTSRSISRITSQSYEKCVDANIFSQKYDEYIHEYGAGKDTRLYGMADFLASVMADNDKSIYDMFLKTGIKKALIALPDSFLSNTLKYGTYLVLIYAALAGALSVGAIAKYISCIMLLLGAVSGLVSTVELSFANHHYLKRYFSYFDIPNDMYKGSLTVEKRDDNEYFVEFRDVSFKYPNADVYALRHVSMKFRIGEKLAVVGVNGSGKTTFIKLLCRLYDPAEGEILLNGVDIKKYDYDEYMSVFSVVFQDFRLFSFPLGQNVAASVDYDRERAALCLEKSGFGDRLGTMPDGVDTCLYKDFDGSGVEISGGEAQKIALARAIYKDAPFIILDEPTAALDPVAEYEVYSNFNGIVGDKTAIYISHRLASCRFCDDIAVFDGGRVIQRGTHDELVADETGKYRELWYAQAQYYSDGPRLEKG